jgi:hypothetical protein
MPVCVCVCVFVFIYVHKERKKQNTYSDIAATVQDRS